MIEIAKMASFEEETSVLAAIFQGSFAESWMENADFVSYVAELTSYGVDRLSRETDHLKEEKLQIDKQTEDLAFNNYKTFIQTANCSSDIFQDFQIIETHVSSLLDKLPEFSSACQNFLSTTQKISQSRKSNTLTLQKHTQLLELLEVPQLMDTCVRNGYYEEALELSAHVRRLERKYQHISVIKTICDEVKQCSQLLLSQLLHQLRSDIQLPTCLRVLGFLRHMDIFTEVELRLKFLQARDGWFSTIISSIPKTDSYQHITKVIEASRVHLFDIITQYRAVFTDDETFSKAGNTDSPRESLILQSWVQMKIEQFLDTLRYDLELGVTIGLDSVLAQCMYFGLSFGRVGCDFRGLLVEVFETSAVNRFSHTVTTATDRFSLCMESYTLILKSAHSSTYMSLEAGALNPPIALLQFSPLGLYCNDILSAFNDLRVCAPLNICTQITAQLECSLSKVADCIINFHRMEQNSFTPDEVFSFRKMCEVFATCLLPHLNKCLQALFPASQIAKALGITVEEVNAAPSLGFVNVQNITEPLQEFLPDEELTVKEQASDTQSELNNVEENERLADEPLGDEKPTGVSLGNERLTGEPLGDERLAGEPLGDERLPGEPLDDEKPTGEPLGDEHADNLINL